MKIKCIGYTVGQFEGIKREDEYQKPDDIKTL